MKFRFLSLIIFCFLACYNSNAQSLRYKIGQMVWTGFTGTRLHDTIKSDLRNLNLGGVILFAGNISNPSQVKFLNDTIKMLASTPPFIAVDQEGGRVARLNRSNGFDTSYTAYKLGYIFNKEDSTRRMAAIMAGWLQQSGFNVNLAPVADVNVNPNSPAIGKLERSYSAVPESVYYHTKWFADEFNKKKIAVSLKHYPGHGSALQDSHLGFTDITNTWSSDELIPYKRLVADGFTDFVMTGHLYHAGIDSVYPASLSHKAATQLLRDSIGFNGVVITDAMGMSAITQNYTFTEAVELAIRAGNDILLYTATLSSNISLTRRVINIIEQAVLQGRITQSRIDEAYERIIAMKQKYGLIAGAEDIARETAVTPVVYQNYPNPFRGQTEVSFYLPEEMHVTVTLYNVCGEIVNVPAYGIYRSGSHVVRVNGLASGVYFLRLTAGSYSATRKLISLH
ncbi:MAG: T9SS type A sorting domain-containing protein [Ignavibacteriaceae bacterium]|nr:T9SS type A sorting domain-containing protein [Ignavibacteriaceae bacterium]